MLKHPKLPLPLLPPLLSHTCVHPLVEELPSKFTTPTHIITAKMIMRDPAVLMALKEWPNFDKIRDATDANVADHPWYQIGRPINKGKGHAIPLDPLQTSDNAAATTKTLEEPWPSATISSEPTTPTQQTQKQQASARSMTPATGKTTTSATPSSCRQIFNGVVIITPSWQQSGWQTSSLASQGAATSQSHLTTPSCPVTPNATPMEHMEEEITALWQQHMEMAHDLLDTCHKLVNTQQALADTQTKLQTLCNVAKALRQHLYLLPHSSPDAPGPSHPSPITFAITSHQAVIPTDGARILDLVPTMMVQEVAIDTSILQNLPGDMLLAPSTLLPPLHCFAYSSTPGVGEAQPPIYVSLGAVANHAGGDDANDEDAANWMDVD
ncbi:hypothetical protein F5J12DRAFT_779174 [Pisolithus orientalis]|uniref:uncharacterized protein n=1 Tax=Pisolithus orientalis TaxID=936130 RepID=UPI002225A208|nr:uncharacterized protein F5J12DRAFT_779174 [Pisolithus orientalis]KAI6032727.1 hypothetical protein F5J12DRAFT_779174 [Pisolithus orientalis]